MWMSQMLADNPYLTATALVEGTAAALDQQAWLHDDTHWIWDLAVDIVEAAYGCP